MEKEKSFDENLQEQFAAIDKDIAPSVETPDTPPKPKVKKGSGTKPKNATAKGEVKKTEPKEKGEKPPNKERFLKSKTYKWKVDLVEALLEDDKYYTKTEVDALIEKYMNSEVK